MNSSRPVPPPPPPLNKPSNDLAALTAQPFASTMPASAAPTVLAPPVAPAPVAEELTDLTDDENVESWAMSGTKILEKPKTPTNPPPPVQAKLDSTMPSAPPPPMMTAPSHAPSHSYPPVAMAAAPSFAPPPVKKKTNWLLWGAAASLVGLFGLVAVGGGGAYYFYRASQQAALEESNRLAAAAQTNVTTTDTQDDDTTVTDTTDTHADAKKNEWHVVTPTTTATSTFKIVNPAPTTTATTTHTTVTTTNTTTPAPTKPAAKKGEGTLQTFAAGKGQPIIVDGVQIGVGGTRVKTTCGNHQIAVGDGKARTVNVPCDGTITVGSPDGT